MDTQTLETDRQTLGELDPQTGLQAALDSGRGYGVRLLRGPGSRRGLPTVTAQLRMWLASAVNGYGSVPMLLDKASAVACICEFRVLEDGRKL